MNDGPMIAPTFRVALVDSSDTTRDPDVRTRATRDSLVIRQWAATHGAEPATGEGTSSGAPTVAAVNDGGTGLRFNFPGPGAFRPISWDEWLEHFEAHDLVFLYENDAPGGQMSYRWRVLPMSQLRETAQIV